MTREEILKEMEKTARHMNYLVEQLSKCNNENESTSKREGEIVKGKEEVNQIVANFIYEMGIPIGMRGYQYLQEAVCLFLENDKIDWPEVNQTLFRTIAEKHQMTPISIEDRLRYTIKMLLKKGNPEKLKEIFGESSEKKLNQKERIVLISEYIRSHYLQ